LSQTGLTNWNSQKKAHPFFLGRLFIQNFCSNVARSNNASAIQALSNGF
jgi:hypothetical protein